ncbi:MAG TPA: four helix bundle protein [Gemmatimonadaceae bacterium]|nr:four helix bundle protein [Gemmatimonadaceae bacterium]
MIRSYRDLHVWQLGIRLVIEAYQVGQQLPADERFGLTAQLRRAAVSVPANIAEGHGRSSRGDYRHHVWIATGSLRELETLVEILTVLEYVDEKSLEKVRGLCDELGRMLTRLAKRLESPAPRRSPATPCSLTPDS